jgi:hypothetical protein
MTIHNRSSKAFLKPSACRAKSASLGVKPNWRKNECSFMILAKNRCVSNERRTKSIFDESIAYLPSINT